MRLSSIIGRNVTLSLWVGAALLSCVSVVGAEDGTPRLGVIADPEVAKEGDLLSVEVTKAGVDLLERGELEKVLREHQMQMAGLTRAKTMQAGRLLKADGLLFLRRESTNEAEYVHARLVAVDPGAIVWVERYLNREIREKTIEQWAREFAQDLRVHLPKLQVKVDRAVAVSFVKLDAPVGDPQGVELDRDLNRLIRLRLLREPTLFVLDRDNLLQLEEEKRWSGDAPDFWTGGRLVDGTIRPDLVTTNKLAISLRIRTSDGKVQSEFAEQGTPVELPSLTDRLIVRLARELGQPATGKTWSAQDEAKEFLKAATQSRFHSRSKAALESAWVLGCRDEATARLYMKALVGDAQFAGIAPYRFLPERMDWRGSRGDEYMAWLSGCPDRLPEAIQRVRNALGFLTQRKDAIPKVLHEEHGAWSRMGLMTVNTGVWVLKVLNQRRAIAKYRDEAAALQNECRQALDVIWRPGYEFAEYVTEDVSLMMPWLWNTPEELESTIERTLLPPLPTWADPIMGHSCHTLLRETLVKYNALVPALPELGTQGGRDTGTCWTNLLAVLSASEVGQNRVYAARVLRDTAKTQEERAALHRKFCEVVWECRGDMAKGWLTFWNHPFDRESEADRELAVKLFEYVCENLSTGYAPLLNRISDATVDRFVQSRLLKPEQAKRVLTAARSTLNKVPKSSGFDSIVRLTLARYPELKDPPKVPPLRVASKLFIVNNETTQEPMKSPPATDAFHWVDGRVWFFWEDVFGLDLKTRNVTFVKGPALTPEEFCASVKAKESTCVVRHFLVTEKHFVVMYTGTPYDGCPTRIFTRGRDGGDWKSTDIRPTVGPKPFAAGDAVYAQYRIVPDVTGVFRVEVPSCKVDILSDTLGNNPGFSKFEEIAPAKSGGVLIGSRRDGWSGEFDPGAGSWKRLSKVEGEERRGAGTRIGEKPEYCWWSRRADLRARLFDDKLPSWEKRPLDFVDIPYDRKMFPTIGRGGDMRFYKSYNMILETPTSFLFPFYFERGFWEIPYADAEAYITALDAAEKKDEAKTTAP